MDDASGWSTEQLIAHAQDNGFPEVTNRRLETWRNQELLPRPVRVGQDGLRPLFRSPEGTQDLMLELARLSREFSDPAQLRARLWLKGRTPDATDVRFALLACLDSIAALFEDAITKEIAKSTRHDGTLMTREEALRSIARQAVLRRRRNRLLPVLVKGTVESRVDAVHALLEIVLTGEAPADGADLSISIDRALGVLPRARIDRPRQLHGRQPHTDVAPWHDGTPVDLTYLASVMGLPALHEAVRSATTEDLELARQISGPLVSGLFWFQHISAVVYDNPNTFGLGLFGLHRQRKQGGLGPAYMTCAILALLGSDSRSNVLAVHQAVDAASRAAHEVVARVVRMPADEFGRRTKNGDREAVKNLRKLRHEFSRGQATDARRP